MEKDSKKELIVDYQKKGISTVYPIV